MAVRKVSPDAELQEEPRDKIDGLPADEIVDHVEG
jgi:hypothetical protein